MVYRFGAGPLAAFPKDWDVRQERFGPGITVVRTSQCPYIENATAAVLRTAQELGIPAHVVELKTAKEVQELSPSPYGSLAILYNGKLASYYYLARKDMENFIKSTQGESDE
jgi:hypothetical protein